MHVFFAFDTFIFISSNTQNEVFCRWCLLTGYISAKRLKRLYTIMLRKILNNDVQETPQWISSTTPSLFLTTRSRSPAATRTTPLRKWLAALEWAVRGNARHSRPRSVPRESALRTPEPVNLRSELKLLRMDKVEDRPTLCLPLTLIGAQMPSTSAE